MMLRIIGAVLVVVSCTGFGFLLAMNYKAEERSLRQLLDVLNRMECQLQYSMISLPELAKSAAAVGGVLGEVFADFAEELDTNCYSSPFDCMNAELQKQRIPPITNSLLLKLGKSLGSFDLDGQVKAMNAIRMDCEQQIKSLTENKDVRIRNYQTLGICAGAALAILLI